MTNYERIKNMSKEEIAREILSGISSDPCDYCQHIESNGYCNGYHCRHLGEEKIIIEWLEKEVEE